MSTQMLVTGGQVVTEEGAIEADVLIENGTIARVGPKLRSDGETVDARACWVLPGVIDPHVHVLQEGHHMLEPTLDDLEEASRVGLFGGVTSVFAYALRTRDYDLVEMLRRQISYGERASYVDFGINALCLPGDDVETAVEIGAKQLGIRTYKGMLGYNRRGLMLDDETFFRLLSAAGRAGALVLVHPEHGRMIDFFEDQARKAGATDFGAHLRCAPSELEAEAMFRTATLAQLASANVLFVHLTSAIAASTFGWLKSTPLGAHLVAETQPHYALLTNDATLARGPLGKVGPPLRDAFDRDAVRAALTSGLISHLSSDHSPRNTAVKLAKDNILDAPYGGISGTEVLLPLAHAIGPEQGCFDIVKMAQLVSTNAAKVYGAYPRKGTIRPGSDGDLTILPIDGPAKAITPTNLHGRSDYSLYEGLSSRGFPRDVIRGGVRVIADGEMVARAPVRYLRAI